MSCILKAHSECGCHPDKCKMQITYVKPRPQPCNATYYGFSAAAAIAIWLVFVAVNGGL